MTQMQSTPMRPRAVKPRSNVYTVLMIIAAVALLAGVVAVTLKSRALYGDKVGLFEVAPVTSR